MNLNVELFRGFDLVPERALDFLAWLDFQIPNNLTGRLIDLCTVEFEAVDLDFLIVGDEQLVVDLNVNGGILAVRSSEDIFTQELLFAADQT